MMREVIEFVARRGALLHPEALRLLQALDRPLDHIERLLPSGQLPVILTPDLLQGQLGAVTAPVASSLPPRGGLAAAVAAAATSIASPPPPRRIPVLPPEPMPPGASPAVPGGPAPRPSPPSFVPLTSLPALAPAPALAHGVAPRDALPPSLAPAIEVLKDITGKSTCTGDMGDFTRYFNDRLRVLRRELKKRRELAGAIDIDRIPRNQNTLVKLIGIVSDVRTTKNGYRILELEDATGVVPVLVTRGDHHTVELGEDAQRVMQDEVVGVVAKVREGKDLLYLESLFRPDVENDFQPRRAAEAGLACFISDVHFGAKTFLQEPWERFLRFLNGQDPRPEERALAKQVKFLVIAGDMVDGIGVYPGQESELAIPDIGGQYEFAAQQLARVPDHVRIVMLPGNHDAVRPAEPQPAMADRLRRHFKPNVTFVGNPCQVGLAGVEVLAYHGVSLIDYVQSLRGLDVHKPIDIMKEIMLRRHLAPMYGGATPFAPEARDYLVIERVPDVFVTGHLHTCDMSSYKGVTLINAGTWQAQTSYQKTLGIEPEPARVPTVDLRTGQGKVLRFDQAG